jgi:DNA-binding MarR family transcriptional regulator
MKVKHILNELIEHLDKFEKLNEGQQVLRMDDFVGYLNMNLSPEESKGRELAGNEAPWIRDLGETLDNDISRLISLMNRYAKGYIKKALKDSLIQTSEEFSFLVILMTFESLSKTELILKNVMEKTSGIEIIKRLIRANLISQFDDLNDKRSQRVAITAYGRTEIIKLLPQLEKASKVIGGNLTYTEKTTLLHLLKKLDIHHNDLFLNKKEESLETILNY